MSSSKLTNENIRQLTMPRTSEFMANPPAWFRNLTLKATGTPYVASKLKKNRKSRKNRRANRKTRRNRRS